MSYLVSFSVVGRTCYLVKLSRNNMQYSEQDAHALQFSSQLEAGKAAIKVSQQLRARGVYPSRIGVEIASMPDAFVVE